jgi:hypothetical protein
MLYNIYPGFTNEFKLLASFQSREYRLEDGQKERLIVEMIASMSIHCESLTSYFYFRFGRALENQLKRN